MQKRVLPLALARFAASMTGSFCSSRDACVGVLYLDD